MMKVLILIYLRTISFNRMSSKKILLIEDEVNLQDIIKLNLELEGYYVEIIADGRIAIEQLDKIEHFDLVILDVMLPHVSGFDVCRKIREFSKIPIIFLSAKGTTTDRIAGLKLGANDYLPKPFDLEELLLRISVLIGRHDQSQELTNSMIGDYTVDFKTFEVTKEKNFVATLTKREVDLLQLFLLHKGEVVSRDTILEELWGTEQYPTSRTIDNYILNFRKIFEEDPKNPKYFHSIRGVGYKFTP